MPNRTEARPAKAMLTNATGRLPLLRLFSTLLKFPATREAERYRLVCNSQLRRTRIRSGRNTHNKIGKRLVQMYDPQTLKEEGKLVRTNNWHYARHVR